MTFPRTMGKTRTLLAASALLLAGLGGGAAFAVTGGADAATGSSSAPTTGAGGRAEETPLAGATAAKVKAAALAKYPGATVERVETDSDGVYEAHVTTKAGEHVIVQVDRAFAVTGTETRGGHDGRGGPGGHGGRGGPDETALTGTTAAKVEAAALAKYPGATVERVETDSDGVYEAHVTTKAGEHVIVQVDKAFAVTGTETRGGHDGPGGPRRHGVPDGSSRVG